MNNPDLSQVASWGGDLLDRGVLTVSLAPRDNHEAQVQFALERGIPAILGVISTQRLPFPSNSFDMAHCSRCLIPWTEFGNSHTNSKLAVPIFCRNRTPLSLYKVQLISVGTFVFRWNLSARNPPYSSSGRILGSIGSTGELRAKVAGMEHDGGRAEIRLQQAPRPPHILVLQAVQQEGRHSGVAEIPRQQMLREAVPRFLPTKM